MKLKFIFRLIFLVFCLALVIAAMQLSSSSGFKDGLNQIFATDVKTLKWCPNHVVDFNWLEKNMKLKGLEKWMAASPKQIEKTFCSLAMEPVNLPNLPQLELRPLVEAQSAEAKTALLEWNPESKLYRVQGMLFKSSSLSRELLDADK